MRDFITLGPAPYEEKCIMVSKDEDYFPLMKQEAEVYKRMLKRLHPDPPSCTYFTVKTFPHDFGAYCEVAVIYSTEDEEGSNFAYEMEGNAPEHWDEQAQEELKQIQGYNPR